MSRLSTLAVAAAVVTSICGVAAAEAGAGSEDDLFGPRYHSVSVTKDGQPKTLVGGTKLRVKFRRERAADEASWHSGCNFFGANVEVEASTIEFGPIVSTTIGCERPLVRQDRFFARFFASNPAWSAAGRVATLSNARVTVELKRRVR